MSNLVDELKEEGLQRQKAEQDKQNKLKEERARKIALASAKNRESFINSIVSQIPEKYIDILDIKYSTHYYGEELMEPHYHNTAEFDFGDYHYMYEVKIEDNHDADTGWYSTPVYLMHAFKKQNGGYNPDSHIAYSIVGFDPESYKILWWNAFVDLMGRVESKGRNA